MVTHTKKRANVVSIDTSFGLAGPGARLEVAAPAADASPGSPGKGVAARRKGWYLPRFVALGHDQRTRFTRAPCSRI